MEVRREYKLTEVGIIPEDWGVEAIGDLACITTGAKNTQDRQADGLYPFFVRSQKIERINSWSYDGEAVLTAGDGVGTGKVFHYINGKFDVHQRVYRISDFSPKLIGYFFFLYFSNNFYARIMQMTAKSSVDSVRMEMIAGMKIPIPATRAEQSAIATALGDVDALLAAQDALIAKKRAIKQGAMQELLTGKRRLPGFSGEWEVKRLGDFGQTYGGLVGKSKNDFGQGSAQYVPFVNVISNVVVDLNALDKVDVSPDESQNRVLKGDLLFNGSSETPQEVALCALVVDEVYGLYLNSFCFGFRLKDSARVSSLFLTYYMRGQIGRDLIKSLAQGSTRYNLSKSAFLDGELKLPSAKEQTAIAEVLSDMDAELAALEAQRAKTAQLKQGMMQALLTGRIRLV